MPYRGDTRQSIVTVAGATDININVSTPRLKASLTTRLSTTRSPSSSPSSPCYIATPTHGCACYRRADAGLQGVCAGYTGLATRGSDTRTSQEGALTCKNASRTPPPTYPPASSRHLVSNMHGTVDRMWVGKARRGLQWCSHRPTLHRFAGNEYRTTQRAQMAMYSAPLRSHPDRCRKRRAPIWHVAPGQPQPERCPNKLKHKR